MLLHDRLRHSNRRHIRSQLLGSYICLKYKHLISNVGTLFYYKWLKAVCSVAVTLSVTYGAVARER